MMTVRQEMAQRYETEASTRADVRTLREAGWECRAEFDGPFWVIAVEADDFYTLDGYTVRYRSQIAKIIALYA